MRKVALMTLIVVMMWTATATAQDGFKAIFDGKSMAGWKASENKSSWKVEDDALVCNGPRSHLYYVGQDEPFVNFELKADVMTRANSNAGIYFHVAYQETGWPKLGYEVQVNNTHGDPQKTGSLYAVVPVLTAPAKDDEYFPMHVTVRGNRVTVVVAGKMLVDYHQPKDKKPGKDFARVVDRGTFALQAHDPVSKVYFKNIRVKRLP